MKLYSEKSISDFEFWSGAKETAEYLTRQEFGTIESILEDIYPDGMSETQLNDLFWFEENSIADWLGYSDFEEIMNRDKE